MFPLPAIFVLRYIWIYISSSDGGNETFYIKALVNDFFGGWTILRVLYIDPYDGHIRFQRNFVYVRFRSNFDIIENVRSFDYAFHYIRINEGVCIFNEIRNSQNLEIRFGLGKSSVLKFDTTMRPLWSDLMKSITISNLMLFKAQFMLVTWSPDDVKNFLELLLPIGIIICLQEKPFIVILICSLKKMLDLFMVLWIFLIFLSESLGKFSLSLRISQTLGVDETCIYEHAGLGGLLADLSLLSFFTWFLVDDSLLVRLAKFCKEEMLVNSAGLAGGKWVDFLLEGTVGTCVVNFSLILSRNVFWPSSTSKLSYPPLKIEKTNSKATLLKPVKHEISSSLWFWGDN